MEISQENMQVRVDETANEIRAFARDYASAVEAHCLSLLRRLEELRLQRRWDVDATVISSYLHLSTGYEQKSAKMLGKHYKMNPE